MRKHHERILVGLDIDRKEDAVNQGSRQAARQAAWLAERTGARLRFVHSTFDDRLSDSVELTDVLRATLEDFVAEFTERGLEAELLVSSDRAWHVLITEVLAGRGDLVVVGKREHEDEKGRNLGAVSRKLLRKCPCPVWVVRPEHDLVHRLVLAATDFSEVGQRALAFAGYIAGSNEDCELHVVHAYRLPDGLKSGKVEDTENDAAISEFKRSLRARIKSALPPEAPKPKIHLKKRTPAFAIREVAENLAPDLLCLGTLSRQPSPGYLVGTTAERILEYLHGSLWTAKPDGFVSPVRSPSEHEEEG